MRTLLVAVTSAGLLAGCAWFKSMTSSGSDQPAPARPAAAAPAADDTTVTNEVKAALAADPELSGQKITVQSAQGAVQLKGEIKTIALRRKAETVAKGVKGVKTVDNQLVITG
jgi:osmotically-inducible protein OsmY